MNRFFKFFIISAIFKLVLSAALPISADESYYWVWSQNLQLSYFDHPGMVAWLFKIGSLFGFGSALRWPFVLIGHATILIWYFILRDHLPEKRTIWILSLFLFSPLLGFGSIVGTPDVPVVFFWSLSTLFFLRAEKSKSPADYISLGAALGLGFCSKYHIVLFVPAAILYLVISKNYKNIVWKNMLLLIFSGFIFSLPVLVWNYQNNFSSFLFQIDHGVGGTHWDPYWTWSYVLGSVLLFFPYFIYLALQKSKSNLILFLKCMVWFPLGFFLFTSLRGHVELNWPIVSLPALFAVAVLGIDKVIWIKIHNYIWGALLIALLFLSLSPDKTKLPDNLKDEAYYAPLKTWVHKYSPLYVSTYQMASILWYQTKTPVYKLPEMSRIDYYDKISNPIPTNSFYLIRETAATEPVWVSRNGFIALSTEKITASFELVYFSKK